MNHYYAQWDDLDETEESFDDETYLDLEDQFEKLMNECPDCNARGCSECLL